MVRPVYARAIQADRLWMSLAELSELFPAVKLLDPDLRSG